MAARTAEKRPRHPPGFYHTLHNCSTVDILGVGVDVQGRKHGKLRVNDNHKLPEGCYEVEHLVAKKRKKVLNPVTFMHVVTFCIGDYKAVNMVKNHRTIVDWTGSWHAVATDIHF